jgi:serine/threonine protein kinase
MTFDPRWKRIQSLLEAIEAIPSDSQLKWLESNEADGGIRLEVLEMLAALRAEADARSVAAEATPFAIPTRIGQYRIERRLGVGGRSVVYLASREAGGTLQSVAVKVLLDHLVDATDLQRFDREKRILSSLNHPSICRFLDAGQDDKGRPYLAMEWIHGEPIDQYCQRIRADHRTRIQLVLDALEALQVAHQSLIVHLDLKPSNLLVDRQGRLKVVDFGTAKLLDDLADSTRTRLMTPRYASPEQLRGDAVSTASDIFSMAMTLHELLVGQTSERRRSSLAALAERASGGATIPATGIDADLDAVLRKAMEPEAKHRYLSASEFAEDLKAYLDQRPVRARRPTLTYHASRFVARNRGGVSIVATLVMALLGFVGYALYQQSKRVEASNRARETARFLTAMIESSAAAQVANPNLTVVEMVERADARIESGFSPSDDVAARLQSSFAYLLREAGRDQQALGVAERAQRRAEASQDVVARVLARQSRSEILIRLGRCAEAVDGFRQADSLFVTARREMEASAIAAFLLARANAESRCEARPEAALQRLGEAAAIPGVAPVTQAAIYNVQAMEQSRLGRNAEALASIEKGFQAAKSHPDGSYFQVALLRMRSQVQRRGGDLAAAGNSIAEAIQLAPGRVNRFEALRLPLLKAGILAELKQFGEAKSIATKAVSRAGEAGAAAWMLHADAAEVFARCGECALALQTYETVDRLTGGKIPNDWRGNRLFFTADCLAKTEPARAAVLAREALDVYGKLLPNPSPRRNRLMVLSGQE